MRYIVTLLMLCTAIGVAQTRTPVAKPTAPPQRAAARSLDLGADAFKPRKAELLQLADELTSTTEDERKTSNYARQHRQFKNMSAGVKDLTAEEQARVTNVPAPDELAIAALNKELQELENTRAARAAEIQAQASIDSSRSEPVTPVPVRPQAWQQNKYYLDDKAHSPSVRTEAPN